MDKMIITKNVEWYRPYFINGIELDKICIYDKSGVIFETNKTGYFEEYLRHYNKDIYSICIDTPKKANKVNFDRQDNFYISKTNFVGKRVYVLYINKNNIDVELIGTEKEEMSEGYYHEYNIYKLTCKNGCYVVDYTGQEKTNFIVKSFDKTTKTDKTTEYDTVRKNINDICYVDIYSIEKARQVYTELKAFFEKYE